MEKIEDVTIGKTIATIYQDTDAQSPDEYGDDCLFLVANHRDFFVKPPNGERNFEPQDVINEYKKTHHVFGLEAYIHSGVVLALSREGNFVDRQWDVSQLGAVFASKKEWKTCASARKAVLGYIKTWNQYLSGDVYGYSIEDEDSCWGFYGIEDARGAATEAAQSTEAHRIADFIARKKIEITKHVPLERRTSFA